MRLESVYKKSLDSDVEKKGASEIKYKDSYGCLYDEDEISDDLAAAYEAAREERELWGASDLGKYTINTPIQDKQALAQTEKNIKPVPEHEFVDIEDDLDKVDEEMQKKISEDVASLEGIF